jgi:hypothetical protein
LRLLLLGNFEQSLSVLLFGDLQLLKCSLVLLLLLFDLLEGLNVLLMLLLKFLLCGLLLGNDFLVLGLSKLLFRLFLRQFVFSIFFGFDFLFKLQFGSLIDQ